MEAIIALFAQVQDNPSQKLEHKLWKEVYSSIKQMRSTITDETKPAWLDFINTVSLLYNDLITAQINSNPSKPVWSKSFNCLGDLARYSIQCLPADQHQLKWDQAKSFYQAALCIQPKNGLFFNQIGICSNAQRRHLEAIILFSRSLLIPSPFVNAREPLLMTFEKLENFGRSLLLGVESDHTIIEIEICLGKLGKLLISKINVESAPIFLNQTEILLNSQFDLPLDQGALWWFYVAQMVICAASLIHETVDQNTRSFMENISYDLAKIVLLAALSKETPSSQLCSHLLLAWIISREISSILDSNAVLEKLSSLTKACGPAVPFENISQIGYLPEDSILAFFTPIKGYVNETIKTSDYSQSNLAKKPKCRAKRSASKAYSTNEAPTVMPNSLPVELGRPLESETIGTEAAHTLEPFRRTPRTAAAVQTLPPAASFRTASLNEAQKSFDFADFMQGESENIRPKKPEMEKISTNIQQLKSRKEVLNSIKKQSRKIDLSKSLVLLDTNSYLNESASIFTYIENSTFQVILPLAVFRELIGLEMNQRVGKIAKEVVDFLRQSLDKITIVSSSGQRVPDLSITAEIYPEYTAVDDVILQIAKLENVMLVTDDVNLRLKARVLGIRVFESTAEMLRKAN